MFPTHLSKRSAPGSGCYAPLIQETAYFGLESLEWKLLTTYGALLIIVSIDPEHLLLHTKPVIMPLFTEVALHKLSSYQGLLSTGWSQMGTV